MFPAFSLFLNVSCIQLSSDNFLSFLDWCKILKMFFFFVLPNLPTGTWASCGRRPRVRACFRPLSKTKSLDFIEFSVAPKTIRTVPGAYKNLCTEGNDFISQISFLKIILPLKWFSSDVYRQSNDKKQNWKITFKSLRLVCFLLKFRPTFFLPTSK